MCLVPLPKLLWPWNIRNINLWCNCENLQIRNSIYLKAQKGRTIYSARGSPFLRKVPAQGLNVLPWSVWPIPCEHNVNTWSCRKAQKKKHRQPQKRALRVQGSAEAASLGLATNWIFRICSLLKIIDLSLSGRLLFFFIPFIRPLEGLFEPTRRS